MSIWINVLSPLFSPPFDHWTSCTGDAVFYKAGAFNSDLSAWNVRSVTGMDSMFEKDLNTIKDGQIHDIDISFEQGVWCTKLWLNAPFITSNIPAGNKILCCQPGTHLRCTCPDFTDDEKSATANASTTGCCPTTNYSVT
jgi:surface protein